MDPLFTLSAYFHKLECQRLPFPTQSTLLSLSFHSSRLGLSPILQPKIVEENLTYAELDLMKPIPEPKASRGGTVYAQILFGEQQL